MICMAKTADQISKNMRNIRTKGSDIELLLRKELWCRGLRYRKNVATVIGKPDIAFIGKKVAVFCDSEFWHGYNWETQQEDFTTNREFWIDKIERNIQHDKEVTSRLRDEGWIVLRFWGKELRRDISSCADLIEAAIQSRHR